ncbi:MAG: hypothetical protein HY791_35575 [Deltaproteobacteria bacterium]|nr:hypothetical protein [Deltaproteobacteria bacterium]
MHTIKRTDTPAFRAKPGLRKPRALFAIWVAAVACERVEYNYVTRPEVDSGVSEPPILRLLVRPSPAYARVPEGDVLEFALRLDRPPESEVIVEVATTDALRASPNPSTLTFEKGSTEERRLRLQTLEDQDASDDTVLVSLAGAGVQPLVFEIVIRDADAPGIEVQPTSLVLREGDSAELAVRLRSAPATDVNLTLEAFDLAIDPPSLSFSPASWEAERLVRVSALRDGDSDDATLELSLFGGGFRATVRVDVVDVDSRRLSAAPTTLDLREGSTDVVGVSLSAPPERDLTVTATLADPDFVVVPATRTFSIANWRQTQNFRVTARNDDDDVIDEQTSLVISGPLGSRLLVPLRSIDDDMQELVLAAGQTEIPEGGSGDVGVRLLRKPAEPAEVALMASERLRVARPTLSFGPTNFDRTQWARVSATIDDDTLDETATLELATTDAPTVSHSILVRDQDVQLIVTNGPARVSEGASDSFWLRLAHQPGGPVEVTATSGSPERLSLMDLLWTFDPSNWSVSQLARFQTHRDLDASDDPVAVTLSSSATPDATTVITIEDREALVLQVSPTSLDLVEGTFADLTLNLNLDPQGPVSIRAQGVRGLSIEPDTVDFDPSNFSAPRSLRVTAIEDNNLVHEVSSLTLYSAQLGTSEVRVSVTDDDEQQIVVQRMPAEMREGSAYGIEIEVAYLPSSPVRVFIASSNGEVVASPAFVDVDPSSYNSEREVTLTAVRDPDSNDDAVEVRFEARGPSGEVVAPNRAFTVLVRDCGPAGSVCGP